MRLVPTGGVNLETVAKFIQAGAAALGVGGELIQKDAVQARQTAVIEALARQYVELVASARAACQTDYKRHSRATGQDFLAAVGLTSLVSRATRREF